MEIQLLNAHRARAATRDGHSAGTPSDHRVRSVPRCGSGCPQLRARSRCVCNWCYNLGWLNPRRSFRRTYTVQLRALTREGSERKEEKPTSKRQGAAALSRKSSIFDSSSRALPAQIVRALAEVVAWSVSHGRASSPLSVAGRSLWDQAEEADLRASARSSFPNSPATCALPPNQTLASRASSVRRATVSAIKAAP